MSLPFGFSQNISAWYIFLAFLLVFLNAFFVAAEFAMVKVRTTRLETLQKKGNLVTRWAYAIVQELNNYLSACQLGITLASLGLGWVGEPAFAKLLIPALHRFQMSEAATHGISFTVAFAIITMLHLVLGELVPKQLAIQTAEKIILLVAIPMRLFYWTFFPFLWILNAITNLGVKIFSFKSGHADETHTEEEIRLIVEDSYELGSLSPRKANLLENVFAFTRLTARHIMVPREEIFHLLINKTTSENLAIIKESAHTRFPLCLQDLDHVVGLVNIKDVIWALEENQLINLYDLKRPILFVQETMVVDQLLREFQTKKIHLAIVQNQEGKTVGLVSLEDVIEELVGEIEDEFDVEPKISKKSEKTFVVDGRATLREVEQALDLPLHDLDAPSIGAYFAFHLGRLAREGDTLTFGPYRVKASEVRNRKITKLGFERLE